MYQSIAYNKNNYTFTLRDDKQGISSFNYTPTRYKIDPRGDYKTLDGKTCTPFKGKFDWEDPDIYEKDVDKCMRVLIDLYEDEDETPEFHNIVYLDIEIEMGGALTPDYIKSSPKQFTAFALYDNNTKSKHCFILDVNKTMNYIEQDSKFITPCVSEEELILKFLDKWEELDPTIVVGYNSDYFDLPYTYYRIKQVLGEEQALRLSPFRQIEVSDFDGDSPVKYAGINNLDYIRLYKKYITKQQPSYKLGDIGFKEIGLGKIEYEGSLDKLFRDDINEFINYNLRDVEIIVGLEEKLQFLDLTISTCHLAHVPYYDCYQQSKVLEGFVLTYLKRNNIVCFNKPATINPSLRHQKQSYMGGFLLDPKPGLYKWLIDLDMSGLYPSLIMSLNISPETYIGRLIISEENRSKYSLQEILKYPDSYKFVVEDKFYDKRKTITKDKLIKYIKDNNISVACNGAMYRNDIEGVIPKVLKQWQIKRDECKALMKQYGKEGNQKMYKFYTLQQKAYKQFLVSAYGAHGLPGWRFFNLASAEAITSSGQELIQFCFNKVSTHLEEYLPENLRTNQNICTYADTDSNYYELYPILKHLYDDLDSKNDEELIKICSDIALKSEHFINGEFKNYGLFQHNVKTNTFNMKTECVLKSGLFTGKRRYAQYIVSKEGIPVVELDIKGLDIIKSNFPIKFKEFGEDLLKSIMFFTPKPEIDKKIINFKNSISGRSIKEVSKPTGLKKLEEYIASYPTTGEIFSRVGNKCPINTKSAIYYNDLVRYHKVGDKFDRFQVGDKMYVTYLKNNPYKIDSIGFNGYNDPPQIAELIDKYVDKDKLFNSIMQNKLDSLYEDLGWDKLVYNPNVSKFFKF
jgi:DNA polymerase elongation subunit (family B)